MTSFQDQSQWHMKLSFTVCILSITGSGPQSSRLPDVHAQMLIQAFTCWSRLLSMFLGEAALQGTRRYVFSSGRDGGNGQLISLSVLLFPHLYKKAVVIIIPILQACCENEMN